MVTQRDAELLITQDNLEVASGPFVRALTQSGEAVTACIEIPSNLRSKNSPLKVRALSALIRNQNGAWNVSCVKGTEKFWLVD